MKTITIPSIAKSQEGVISSWLKRKAKIMSIIIEQEVNHFQALLITQAIVSFSLLVFSTYTSVIALLGCLLWFIVSMILCKRNL
jgi:hypothetical protein